MSDRFRVTRQHFREQPPVSGHLDEEDQRRLRAQQGGAQNWFWGVPGVFHALTSPLSGQAVPSAPEPGDLGQALGYWTALHYLLLHRLGWASPDRGLRWWYDQGKPVDDPTLALISEVWDRDGNLDAYLAWLLQGRPVFLDPELVTSAEWPSELDPLPPRWERWVGEVRSAAELSGSQHLQGGWDPMHLTDNWGEGGEPDPASTISVVSRSDRRAVFLTNTMDAWHFDLEKQAKKLPDIGQSFWRVDVIVRPVGFLGTFRRSSVTGLWFTGQHRYHSVGN